MGLEQWNVERVPRRLHGGQWEWNSGHMRVRCAMRGWGQLEAGERAPGWSYVRTAKERSRGGSSNDLKCSSFQGMLTEGKEPCSLAASQLVCDRTSKTGVPDSIKRLMISLAARTSSFEQKKARL